jgi:uncharacterized protein YpmB
MRLFVILCALQLFCGCATTSAVIKACEPSTTDEQQAVINLWERPDLATAEKTAILEGGKIAFCVLTEIAKNVLAQASKIQTSGLLGSESPLVIGAQDWLAKHP